MFISPFLAVQTSFWPLLLSLVLFSLTSNIVIWFRFKVSVLYVLFRALIVLLVRLLWWKDLNRESIIGFHTHKLEFRLRIRILLFILSEVCFFFSFFWAFYDASIAPTIDIGIIWPPKGIVPLSTYSVPLLNTVILLSSGITVTWAHHSLINNFYTKSIVRLALTVFLGLYFIIIQYVEYSEATFTIADGVYGSTFFMATGFHGMHVSIGALFLLYVLFNLYEGKLLFNHHFRFEAAAWYWHFVDVVWLFLFLSVYWWGGL
jgi:cytochrome c oxidase subunit 3